ncbi:hypothetical protein AAG570_004446 [Ranatra chinensis]|uniref:DNA 3'-5' helicase n=1 Tax=Ranatra chinensis TaxID=642074 RepID=A0ABD0YFL4_9HEMI
MRVLSGLSTIVTLATGTGKSLCYQLPAYIYSKRMNCITLVVSPLVSLMEDQVFCGAPCLRVACLHTNMAPKVRETVLEELKEGKLSVLLVSPEALASGDRLASSFLRNLPPIAFACVDEAHCVSQWSRNFRPSYLTVCQVLREKLGVKTILGLTATATVSTVKSIIQQFGIPPSDKEAVISDTPLPDNLLLSVSTDEDRDCALLSLLSSERFSKCSSIIVYCTRREQCDRVAVLLRTALQDGCTNGKSGRISLHAEAYHAGLSAAKRKQVQKHFMTGKLRIVVATVAFGMGINKNDIRAIIHYNMPSSFEKYVQEVGRAGRDRQEAYCHLFLDPKGGDLAELKRHIYSDTVDRHTIRKLLQMVFVSCSCPRDAQCPKHEVAFPIEEVVEALDMPQENIQTLLCYLELHETRWVKALSPAYTTCKVASYKGAKHLRQTAKTCPPLAMALAVADKTAQSSSRLEFDVVKLARAMNWDSGIVKHTLKNLEWTTVDGAPKKSGIAVELSVLGFRMMSTGNLTEEQLDSALDILHGTVLNHEKAGLDQLQTTYNAMKK